MVPEPKFKYGQTVIHVEKTDDGYNLKFVKICRFQITQLEANGECEIHYSDSVNRMKFVYPEIDLMTIADLPSYLEYGMQDFIAENINN